MADATDTTTNAADDDTLPSFISLFDSTEEDSVCDFGDIILVADDGFHPVLKIRVSSCILANTSTFFKALFSKKYAEGQTSGEAGPREVVIKKKPSALRSLCYLLHHKDLIDHPPLGTYDSLKALLELAVTADKYDAAKAIHLQAEALVLRHRAASGWTEDASGLTAIATLFDNVELFRTFSKGLVSQLALVQPRDIPEAELEHLPSDLISSVKAQVAVLRERLTLEITALVSQFANACERVDEPASTISSFLTKLEKAGLWPAGFQDRSLDHALLALEGLDLPVITATTSRRRRTSTGWTCGTCGRKHWGDACEYGISPGDVDAPTHRSLKERADRVRQLCVGVCLDCVRGRTCRKPHRYKWVEDFSGVDWDSFRYFSGNDGDSSQEVEEYDACKTIIKPRYWEDAW